MVHMWLVGSGIRDRFMRHVTVNTSVGRNPSLQRNCKVDPSCVEL